MTCKACQSIRLRCCVLPKWRFGFSGVFRICAGQAGPGNSFENQGQFFAERTQDEPDGHIKIRKTPLFLCPVRILFHCTSVYRIHTESYRSIYFCLLENGLLYIDMVLVDFCLMSCCESESSAAAEPTGSLPPESGEEDLARKSRGDNRSRMCTIH